MKLFAVTWKSLLLGMVMMAGSVSARDKVDINTADAATLDRVMVNVGAAKAQAIVEFRQANGPFRSVEELTQVKGIGLATVDRNRDLITVGDVATPKEPAAVPRR